MESKIDGLIALLDQSQKRPQISPAPSHDHRQIATPPTFQEGSGLGQVTPQSLDLPVRDYQDVSGGVAMPFIGSFEGSDDSRAGMSVLQKLCSRGVLDCDKAQQLLWTFREMSFYFPFVALPLNATVESMSEECPFLLLAVLTVASSAEKSLQKSLDEELRNALSLEVVIDGEKSLDLLQGLLVYLAWCVTLNDYNLNAHVSGNAE